MLLSDRDLRDVIDSGRLGVDPYDPQMIQPSSIDVRLDRYFRVFENHRYPHIDPAEEQPDLTRLVEPEGDDPFILHPGEFVLASTYEFFTLPVDLAGRLEGKALAVHTRVPTPVGWRTMGDLAVGDEVFDELGRPTSVVAASAVMLGRPCREVLFSDGQALISDAAHQWVTTTRRDRRRGGPPAVRTTDEIARTLRTGEEWTHQVEIACPVQYPERDLPVDPYVLGVWLGDGTSNEAEVTCSQRDTHSISSALRAMDLLGNKHVPPSYLQAGPNQRLALLQGLMDSDGYVDEFGRCEFVSTRHCLVDEVVELAASLGLCPVKRKKQAVLNGVDCGPAVQVKFTPHLPVFRLGRKLARQKHGRFHRFRTIVAVREVESQPVRCVQVASPRGLFLVGPTFIPTHNSSLGRLGLLTHSTACFIDPGFAGHVTLELSNVATLPIKLWPGMKIGQLCLFRLSTAAEHPYGSAVYGSRYQGQRGPTPSRSFQSFHRTQV